MFRNDSLALEFDLGNLEDLIRDCRETEGQEQAA